MKKQIKIIMFIMAILMLLQPLMVTISCAVEAEEIIIQEGEITTITISDDALYEALKKELQNKAEFYIDEDKKNTIRIENEELNSITELILKDSKISNLSGIEAFQGLTYLNLSSNNLTSNSNLEKLNELTNLVKLDLSRNKIEDLSAINSLLNKSGLILNLDQDIKTVGFVSIIPDPEEYGTAEDILLNEIREEIELPQILTAYENMNINIEEIKVDGEKINSRFYSKYVEIKDGKIKILDRNKTKIEIKLVLEGENPTNGTTAIIKAYRIDTETQNGIYFKDENFYTAIKEKYEYVKGIKKTDFIHSNYDEWNKYTFKSEWTFDDEDFIVIANKDELRKIREITIESLPIQDLTGLEQFAGITDLILNDDEIINVSKIKELNDNKKLITEEFKTKYNAIVEKLTEQVNTYNDYTEQIKTIEKEIENLRKAIASGLVELPDDETTEEKEAKINKLEIKKSNVITKIKNYINKIEELCGDIKLSKLLTNPSIIAEITEYKENIDDINSDLYSQIDAIQNNKLVDIASRINANLTHITETELTKLATVTLNGQEVITDEQILKAEAKVAIKYMQDYIDTISNTRILNRAITNIGSVTNSTIKTTNNSGEARDISDIKNDLKNALNKYNDSKNKISADDIVKLCIKDNMFEENGALLSESELLIKAKDTVIPIIQGNITTFAENMSEKLIEELREVVVKNAWNQSKAQKALENVIAKLKDDYIELEILLSNLASSLSFSNDDDIIRVVGRLQNLAEEDMLTAIKLPDFENLKLERNNIKTIDELAEIETLEVIELGYNLIDNLDFSKFVNIKKLYLNNNGLSNITISEMKNIHILDLSNNWIENIEEINLSEMPKLRELNLNGNKIQNVENLLKQNNTFIKGQGYNNLGEYISSGATEFKIASQIIDINLTLNTTNSQIEIELPKIFSQLKGLQSTKFGVTFERYNPCIYNDGTKAIIDTSERNIQRQAIAYLETTTGERTIFKINYIVVKDETAPTIEKVIITPDNWNNESVTLTIEGAKDDRSGLAVKAYSFDNGTTWQVTNTKKFTENTSNIIIKVKDVAGNVYTHEPINITNIDTTKPVITVNSKVIDNETGKASVTISIKEDDSKLSEENKYEYYLSTSKDEQKDGEWKTYTPDVAFELGEEKEGKYYLFVKSVKDNANNESDVPTVTEFIFKKIDKIAPTIDGVTGITDVETEENVVLTIVGAKDNVALDDEPYSFDGGLTWQSSNTKEYASNTENISIIVRDAAGNKYTHEKLSITNIKKEETKPNEGNQSEEKADYLTLNGITKIVYAYINNDYSNLSETSKLLAGEDGIFSLSEVTALIRLYLSI